MGLGITTAISTVPATHADKRYLFKHMAIGKKEGIGSECGSIRKVKFF